MPPRPPQWRESAAMLVLWVAMVAAALVIAYRWADPLPPRRFAIAAGISGTAYDLFAREYARILARHGVELEVRNFPGAAEHFDVLRNPTSGVQAAISTFGATTERDAETLYSLGGISDTAVFILHRGQEPVTQLAQYRGKRLSIGTPSTSIRALMLEVLKATGAWDDTMQLVDLEHAAALDALIAGKIDMAAFPFSLDDPKLQQAIASGAVHLMDVSQAEAISKVVPGLRHVVLSRGIMNLKDDLPGSDVHLLAVRNRVLVRQDLHPALQYLLLEAMREVHRPPGPFHVLGQFPAEQANDLPLSPTAQAFYRSGRTFWERYTSFWLSSILNRIVFFFIPVLVVLVPLIGIAPRVYRWLNLRRVNRLHRTLGTLGHELEAEGDASRLMDYQRRLDELGGAVRAVRVPPRFAADLHLLKAHMRLVEEDLKRRAT